MTKQIISTSKIVALAVILSFGLSYVYAWTAPSTTPPTGNVSAPINTGDNTQYKAGNLVLNDGPTPFINGLIVLNGKVGIGTASPAQKLSVDGIIESTSGGVKFPDGTTQATAMKGVGVGQTWQDMTSSRAMNTTYTNTSGKPIQVIANISGDGSGRCRATLDVNSLQISGVQINGYCNNIGGRAVNLSAIIPEGDTYKVTPFYGSLSSWYELR